MKKFLMAIGSGLGVIAGALLIWYAVIPFLGGIFNFAWSFVTGLF